MDSEGGGRRIVSSRLAWAMSEILSEREKRRSQGVKEKGKEGRREGVYVQRRERKKEGKKELCMLQNMFWYVWFKKYASRTLGAEMPKDCIEAFSKSKEH